MKFGVCVANYGEKLSPESIGNVAVEAEKLGYDSLWTTDHILMPRNSQTPYERILDSVVTLVYLASVTKKVKVGISSLIIAMRNPLVVAKQLATVDVLSGGRVMLAVGTGWNEKEFGFVGSNFHDRGKRVNESIKMIRALWAGEESFVGQKTGVKFDGAAFEPRPPSNKISIWIAGASKAAMKRAAELGDAWHPNALPLESFRKLVADFRQVSPSQDICVRIGLDTKAAHSEYTGPQGERRILLSGEMSGNRKILEELESLGVTYAVLSVNADGKKDEAAQMESLRIIASNFM